MVEAVALHDAERLPMLVRYAFWIYVVILVFAIVVGGLLGDNDLTFALAGAVAVTAAGAVGCAAKRRQTGPSTDGGRPGHLRVRPLWFFSTVPLF